MEQPEVGVGGRWQAPVLLEGEQAATHGVAEGEGLADVEDARPADRVDPGELDHVLHRGTVPQAVAPGGDVHHQDRAGRHLLAGQRDQGTP